MTKQKVALQDDIADTLIIPLLMRAVDAKKKRPILGDQSSLELVEKIDYPFEKYAHSTLMSQIGTCVRVKYMDEQVKQFLQEHQNAIVVNIGCGLDDRWQRVTPSADVTFYSLDIPEVIAVRQQLLSTHQNEHLLACSAFDSTWMDDLKAQHPDAHFIFVIEGVLMYFAEAQVKKLLTDLAERFPGSRIVFDALNTFACKNSKRHDTVRHARAGFVWGVDDLTTFSRWDSRLHLTKSFSIMQGMRRYSFVATLITLIPAFKHSSNIITLDIMSSQQS